MSRTQSQTAYESPIVVPEGDSVAYETIFSTDFLSDTEAPVDSWRYRYVKRALDLSFSSIMIIVLTIPGILIAAAILLTSEGPIFYHEERIGRNGRLFRIFKFRSMHRNAAQQACIADAQPETRVLEWRMRKHPGDPRITTVGAFLRCWSLDEIPQFVNVLRGEMSLVGPRPIVEAESALYGRLFSFYLAATPGLSGLWQVSGRSHIDYEKRAKLDAMYVQSWSLRTDLNILLRTVSAVLRRIGAH